MGLNSPVASLFSAGASGAVQDRIWTVHFPWSFASARCSGPGVAALVCASMARWAADLAPASCAFADRMGIASAPAVERHATAAKLDDLMAILPWNGVPGGPGPGEDTARLNRLPAAPSPPGLREARGRSDTDRRRRRPAL